MREKVGVHIGAKTSTSVKELFETLQSPDREDFLEWYADNEVIKRQFYYRFVTDYQNELASLLESLDTLFKANPDVEWGEAIGGIKNILDNYTPIQCNYSNIKK
jgi:Mg/Co/Ni transporter MgtE